MDYFSDYLLGLLGEKNTLVAAFFSLELVHASQALCQASHIRSLGHTIRSARGGMGCHVLLQLVRHPIRAQRSALTLEDTPLGPVSFS